ncbi:MAG: cell division ATP-binding protein FtsE, partial [Cyanobacteria bacterium J06632_3]
MISILSPKALKKNKKAAPAYFQGHENSISAQPAPPQETASPQIRQPFPTTPRDAATPQPTAAPAAKQIIALNQVSKVYANGTPALTNINLALNKGDFLFITGPSGAGKSTLLKMLYGQERPTAGQVHINGQDITQLKGNRLAMLRRRIGIIFQDYKLIPRRTVAENVAFVLHAQGYSRKEIARRLPVTLKMVGLQNKADRFPSQLSGGEQQRASIARAVVGTPPILLADEPTGNLDAAVGTQIADLLFSLQSASGAALVMVTHDLDLAR